MNVSCCTKYSKYSSYTRTGEAEVRYVLEIVLRRGQLVAVEIGVVALEDDDVTVHQLLQHLVHRQVDVEDLLTQTRLHLLHVGNQRTHNKVSHICA